jgi:3-methyladenine DNA glycosylase AlkD
MSTAESVVEALVAVRSDEELATVRKRLAPDEPAIGVRMRHLFDIAKANTDLSLGEVDRLLDHEAYEPRLAAFCILDFQARRRLDDGRRGELYELYLRRHDRITTWDMVDRSAPRVVGGYLSGRSKDPLWQLARSSVPLRRRTAMTAPLAYVFSDDESDRSEALAIAAALADDPDPLVHKPVGIFLGHLGGRDPGAVATFLDTHVAQMSRTAVRLAVRKLDDDLRRRFVR